MQNPITLQTPDSIAPPTISANATSSAQMRPPTQGYAIAPPTPPSSTPYNPADPYGTGNPYSYNSQGAVTQAKQSGQSVKIGSTTGPHGEVIDVYVNPDGSQTNIYPNGPGNPYSNNQSAIPQFNAPANFQVPTGTTPISAPGATNPYMVLGPGQVMQQPPLGNQAPANPLPNSAFGLGGPPGSNPYQNLSFSFGNDVSQLYGGDPMALLGSNPYNILAQLMGGPNMMNVAGLLNSMHSANGAYNNNPTGGQFSSALTGAGSGYGGSDPMSQFLNSLLSPNPLFFQQGGGMNQYYYPQFA
jgi:hypothetical protein